ncbi:deoxyribodipyrimidine photo-lyase/cryptochrome family protein [Candidatus Pelagibacter sp.]|uniref:cryptochrome/deoxyribodipyrimidine photo-lyase family protein n=1 Tax=Candidatus Pelagibacter sp. TaxID=2024849 RepID=UPI003F82B20C
MRKIFWFRNDLRVNDNQAFQEACSNGDVLPIFIFDKDYYLLDTSSSFHLKFIKDSLGELNKTFKEKFNSKINIYYGETLEILKHLTDKFKINEIYSNIIFKNKYINDLDKKCLEFFNSKNINWNYINQFGVQLNHRQRYQWANNWNSFISSKIIEKEIKCNFLSDDNGIEYSSVKTNEINTDFIQKGGRSNAIDLLTTFLNSRSENYQKEMSSPITGEISCSRLSPHITYGTLSLREIYQKTFEKLKEDLSYKGKKSLVAFKSRLAWHCHFIQKLYDEPELEYKNLNSAYDGLRENDFNENFYKAWKAGYTGYPFIDACMRYLNKTGWINFRMRAMLVSFASYQLWLDWKKTSKHMAKVFTDYEPGIHYSQFQMQSGTTGINSIRIYNPIKQSIDQDPTGEFIKKWVPELKEVQGKLIHEPWKLTYIDQKSINLELGKDYPVPIVDNKVNTKIAKDKIWNVKKSRDAKIIADQILIKHASLSSRR